MAQKDPRDGRIPTERRDNQSSVAKGPDEDWVHVGPSEPVCRDLSASSCYVALSEAYVDDCDGALSNDEKAENSIKMDAEEVLQKESDASLTTNVDDSDDAVCNGVEAERSIEIDAKVSPKKSDKSDANYSDDVEDGDDATCNGVEAEQSVEMNANKVSPENNGASNTTEHTIPPTRFNLILMQSKSPILHLLSARLVDRVEGQKPPDDHDSDVD